MTMSGGSNGEPPGWMVRQMLTAQIAQVENRIAGWHTITLDDPRFPDVEGWIVEAQTAIVGLREELDRYPGEADRY